MEQLLGEDYSSYIKHFEKERHYGLRSNALKINKDKLEAISPFQIKPIEYINNGFYYQENEQPAKHPYYYAGLYYIQEPSAMTPANVFPIEKGDKVLDLCAAPGGKSTELGAKLQGTGILFSNDISNSRAKGLLKNIELSGITNVIVSSEPSEKLAHHFKGYFDKILVDAPCSGEGMFRKDPSMIKNWSAESVLEYATLQKQIILDAATMLKPGGLLLYSTCTFAPEENEAVIQHLLDHHLGFTIEPLPKSNGFDNGKPEWINSSHTELENCIRLWPHKINGEGHFIALLRKEETASNTTVKDYSYKKNNQQVKIVTEFIEENLLLDFDYTRIDIIQNKAYYLPEGMPNVKGLRLLRTGWYLGEIKKDRFEPSQSLAMGLSLNQAKHAIDFSVNQEAVIRYLKGESLRIEANKGWNLVGVDGYPLGWGKSNNNMLKNKYYTGWRWM